MVDARIFKVDQPQLPSVGRVCHDVVHCVCACVSVFVSFCVRLCACVPSVPRRCLLCSCVCMCLCAHVCVCVCVSLLHAHTHMRACVRNSWPHGRAHAAARPRRGPSAPRPTPGCGAIPGQSREGQTVKRARLPCTHITLHTYHSKHVPRWVHTIRDLGEQRRRPNLACI